MAQIIFMVLISAFFTDMIVSHLVFEASMIVFYVLTKAALPSDGPRSWET